jgi:predicted transcriptional regulator
MLKFYLWHMVELGLLEELQDTKFKTTDKGEEFLSYYQKIANTLAGLARTNCGGIYNKSEIFQ